MCRLQLICRVRLAHPPPCLTQIKQTHTTNMSATTDVSATTDMSAKTDMSVTTDDMSTDGPPAISQGA